MGSWDGEVASVYVPILIKQSSEFGLWRVDTVSAGDLEGLIVHVTWGRHFIIFAGEKCSSLKIFEKAFDWPRLKADVAATGTREQPVLLAYASTFKAATGTNP